MGRAALFMLLLSSVVVGCRYRIEANTNTQQASLANQLGDPSLATAGLNMRIDIASRRYVVLNGRLSTLAGFAASTRMAAQQRLQCQDEILRDQVRQQMSEQGPSTGSQEPPHYYGRSPSDP